MKLSQTKRGIALIEATLYKKQEWYISGTVTGGKLNIKTGTTQFLGSFITIDFQKQTIKVDGHRQRMRKETSADLINIVKLKLLKQFKYGIH